MKQTVTLTPWRSIRDGIVARAEASHDYQESLASPCLSCTTSPCCSHLPLHTFRANTLGDVNYAGYLLNFAHLRIGIGRSGEWSVYYVYPCRHLDRVAFTCALHDTPEQPRVCANYNPYGCWYRKAFTSADSAELILLDRARFAELTKILHFDEQQRLVDAPEFDHVRAVLAHIVVGPDSDTDPAVATPPMPDAVFDNWISGAQNGEAGDDMPLLSAANASATTPCDGCSAPCCETLVFPQGVPTAASGFDWFRFCLGFPGIELSVSADQWSLVVKSRCQHLQNGRCAIYGKPERPLFCRYYDAWKCTYRIEFGRPRPPASFRVRAEQYDALLQCFDLDHAGSLVAASTFEDQRAHVEAAIRAVARSGHSDG
jgi:hypothetical protein